MVSFKNSCLLLIPLLGLLAPLKSEDVSVELVGYSQGNDGPDKRHILYLMATSDPGRAIDQYLKYYALDKKHDFQILRQISQILLERGLSGPNVETELLALYGLSLSGEGASFHALESAMNSPYPVVQGAALQLLAQKHDDLVDELIAIGLKSKNLMIRFEALTHLIGRKAKNALGQVEALSNLLHPRFRPFFVEFYAIYGSTEATTALRQMIKDADREVRIAAMISASMHGRDDLLPDIRIVLTHPDPILKESAAKALGELKDLHSIQTLKTISKSPFAETKLAALNALSQLGDKEAKTEILELASEGNLYAIFLAASLLDSEAVLSQLALSQDRSIRLNATLALLSKRSPKAIRAVLEILTVNTEIVGFVPMVSPGRALIYWKPVLTSTLHTEEMKQNLSAVTFNFFEDLLRSSIDLPENDFLYIADRLLLGKQTKFIPTLIRLLETIGSDKAKKLLLSHATTNPNALIKAYCNLALYRLGDTHESRATFFDWLSTQKGTKMIEFRPMMDRSAREDRNVSNYELSPEEVSGLMVESFDAIASKHDLDGIIFILEAMRDGHPNNRYALAGLLLKSLQ